jgi:hypothetical protein
MPDREKPPLPARREGEKRARGSRPPDPFHSDSRKRGRSSAPVLPSFLPLGSTTGSSLPLFLRRNFSPPPRRAPGKVKLFGKSITSQLLPAADSILHLSRQAAQPRSVLFSKSSLHPRLPLASAFFTYPISSLSYTLSPTLATSSKAALHSTSRTV